MMVQVKPGPPPPRRPPLPLGPRNSLTSIWCQVRLERRHHPWGGGALLSRPLARGSLGPQESGRQRAELRHHCLLGRHRDVWQALGGQHQVRH